MAVHVHPASAEQDSFGSKAAALAFSRQTGERDAAAVPEHAVPWHADGSAAGEGA